MKSVRSLFVFGVIAIITSISAKSFADSAPQLDHLSCSSRGISDPLTEIDLQRSSNGTFQIAITQFGKTQTAQDVPSTYSGGEWDWQKSGFDGHLAYVRRTARFNAILYSVSGGADDGIHLICVELPR